MASLMPNGKQQYFDSNGNNLSGGKLYAYAAGTSTPLATYSDQAGAVPNTNPVVLNARGEATIFWGAAPYKVILKDASDVEIWTQDNLYAQADISALANTVDPLGGAMVGYSHAGTGAIPRTVSNRLRELVFTTDYGSVAQAKTAAGNKPVYDPIGITHKDTYNHFANTFLESGETTWKAAQVFKSAENAGAHSGSGFSAFQIEHRPIGSGANGPTNADYGLTVSAIKQSFSTTAVVGEMDAVNVVLRNGGVGDSTAILVNVATYGTGFQAAYEGQTSIIASSTVTHQIQTQFGICDNGNNTYVGFFANANTGALNDAYRCDNTAGASWTNFFMGISGGVERFRVSSGGDIFMRGPTGVKKMIGVLDGNFRVVNDAGTQELLNITDAGLVSAFGSITAPSFFVAGNQVVSSRNTGWAAMTGAGNKTTVYDSSSITLNQLAERVNSIQAALTTHGLIGA